MTHLQIILIKTASSGIYFQGKVAMLLVLDMQSPVLNDHIRAE